MKDMTWLLSLKRDVRAWQTLVGVPMGQGPAHGYALFIAPAAHRDGWGDPSGWLRAAEAFFARPIAQKMQTYIGGSSNHSGYVPEGEEVFVVGKVDRKEAYDVGLDCPEAAGEGGQRQGTEDGAAGGHGESRTGRDEGILIAG